jgi:hypothetical protein
MTRDAVELAFVVLAFGALVTVHVALVCGLLARRPRWHGAVAFFLPPFAPYWGARQGLRGRTFAWLALAIAYVVALIFAER